MLLLIVLNRLKQQQMCKKHSRNHQPYNRNYNGAWPRTPARVMGLGFIRLYQLTLSSFIGHHCRHFPTCSEYAFEAIARHGLWAGSWLSIFRISRCGPFGTHGIDRVPKVLKSQYHWYMPWRYWRIGKS